MNPITVYPAVDDGTTITKAPVPTILAVGIENIIGAGNLLVLAGIKLRTQVRLIGNAELVGTVEGANIELDFSEYSRPISTTDTASLVKSLTLENSNNPTEQEFRKTFNALVSAAGISRRFVGVTGIQGNRFRGIPGLVAGFIDTLNGEESSAT